MKILIKVLKILVWLLVIAALVYAGYQLYGLIERKFLYPLKYESYVEKYAREYELPEALVYGVIKTESDFNASAASNAGAVGLMQMLPETYRELCAITGEEPDEEQLKKPEVSVRYGCLYLSQLKARFTDETAYLAAYNAGYGRVLEWLKNPDYAPGGKLSVIPFEETRAYVDRVRSAAQKYQSLYGDQKEWTRYEAN